jgi:hypothetical protein
VNSLETGLKQDKAYQIVSAGTELQRNLKSQLKHSDIALAVSNLIAIVIAAYSDYYFYSHDYTSDLVVITLRSLVSFLTCCSVWWLVSRTHILLQLKKATGFCEAKDTIRTTGLYKQLLFELALSVIHCPPGLDSTFEVEITRFKVTYSVDSVLTSLVLLRLYLAGRVLLHFSNYTTERALWVLKMHKLDVSESFVFKAYTESKPLVAVSAVFLVCSVFWAQLLFIYERPERVTETTCPNRDCTEESILDNFANCFWLVFVTTATVGYGSDMYPYTHIGRAVAMLACILGNVYTGLLVLALQNNLRMTTVQERAIKYSHQRLNSYRLYKSAVQCVRQLLTLKAMHTSFKNKYSGASHLSSIKITNFVPTTKALLPLAKLYGRQRVGDISVLDESDYLSKRIHIRELKKLCSIIKDCTRKATRPGTSWQVVKTMGEGWDIDLSHLNKLSRKMYEAANELKPLLKLSQVNKQKAKKLKTLTAFLSDSIITKEAVDQSKFIKVLKARSSLKNHTFMQRRSRLNSLITSFIPESLKPALHDLHEPIEIKPSETSEAVLFEASSNSDKESPHSLTEEKLLSMLAYRKHSLEVPKRQQDMPRRYSADNPLRRSRPDGSLFVRRPGHDCRLIS